ncbi:hypothetical protein LIA77_08801 [Sarocladium implicatum]|nr:hypothetical protein LIA77_08801 [Sarocladium implicatum]
MQLSSIFSLCAFAAIAASSALHRRQEEQYKLRVASTGGDINGKYLSIRNSQIGLFPDSPPIVVSLFPSSTAPDRVSLHTVSIADVVRVVALNGTSGVYDLFNVDTPPEKGRSWEDWKVVESEGKEKILTWAAAKRDSRSWLAMPVRRPETGQWVWFVDDFEGGFPGITMPIDDIILEAYP